VDFSRAPMHVALRFGPGQYPGLHVEKLLEEWMVPVAHPELVKQYGMIERDTDLEKLPLLDSEDEPWRTWRHGDAREWQLRAPSIDDSAGLLAAVQEGLGYALMGWTLVAQSVQQGKLKLASSVLIPDTSAYYFVCPKSYLAMPKVAHFREWILAAARQFPRPPGWHAE
jgi:LysR family transcriptional regulator, glycine cleavage system transcriptional activator